VPQGFLGSLIVYQGQGPDLIFGQTMGNDFEQLPSLFLQYIKEFPAKL